MSINDNIKDSQSGTDEHLKHITYGPIKMEVRSLGKSPRSSIKF